MKRLRAGVAVRDQPVLALQLQENSHPLRLGFEFALEGAILGQA
jgi:hypothetical protein